MSFTADVKAELANVKEISCCSRAELSALLSVGGAVELRKGGLVLTFQTTNNAVIRKFLKLAKELFHAEPTMMAKKQLNLRKDDIFVAEIASGVEAIVRDLALANRNALFFQHVDEAIVAKECCRKSYLRGAFLAGGSMNSPETSGYHLEIQTFSESLAEDLKKLANGFDLHARTAKNRRGFIMYMKEAEKISDFLRVTGATNELFQFEDSRIKRDFKNSINRVMNCDIANEEKALEAAAKQVELIARIERLAPKQVPASLAEIIFLRKKYPESTLVELGYAAKEHFGHMVSKSAMNHRFRALRDWADELEFEREERA
jgi:DNA-binding protein WhiA